MKKFLVKLFGELWYCKMFHSATSDTPEDKYWHCDKCNLSYEKRISDYSTGPK